MFSFLEEYSTSPWTAINFICNDIQHNLRIKDIEWEKPINEQETNRLAYWSDIRSRIKYPANIGKFALVRDQKLKSVTTNNPVTGYTIFFATFHK